jgi:hypothetical protein
LSHHHTSLPRATKITGFVIQFQSAFVVIMLHYTNIIIFLAFHVQITVIWRYSRIKCVTLMHNPNFFLSHINCKPWSVRPKPLDKIYLSTYQCCGCGMFYLGSGSDYFLIPDSNPNIFSSRIPDPTWKMECKLTFILFLILSGAKS